MGERGATKSLGNIKVSLGIPSRTPACYDLVAGWRRPMADTSIEWTDATWNPVAGCTIVSKGCTNCYAMRMAARLEAMRVEKYSGLTKKTKKQAVWTGRIFCDENALSIPSKWQKPRKIFVNSMSDLFHEDVPIEFIKRVWDVMAVTTQHTYQILTKRPERMAGVLGQPGFQKLPNVWLGTSVEDSEALHLLDSLRKVPAYIRFVSFEPLVGSVARANLKEIDWAIIGGESGPRARPMDAKWVDEIKALCERSTTAFFFKQWGGKNKKAAGRSYKDRTWDDLPTLRM